MAGMSDPTRCAGALHTVDAGCHPPNGAGTSRLQSRDGWGWIRMGARRGYGDQDPGGSSTWDVI